MRSVFISHKYGTEKVMGIALKRSCQ